MTKHCFLYTPVDYAETLNLFPAQNDRYNDVQNMLSISQFQEDRQYVHKFLASNTDSNSDAGFVYINNYECKLYCINYNYISKNTY